MVCVLDVESQPLSSKRVVVLVSIAATATADEKEDLMAEDWNNCAHVWQEEIDSQFSSDIETHVECIRCGCPGAKDNLTGDVFWPAT